jgi:hypothetical protein
VEHSDVTFEWDLARANVRSSLLTGALVRVRPRKGPELLRSAAAGTAWATAFQDALGKDKKAEYAQELAAEIDSAIAERRRRAQKAAEAGEEAPVELELLHVPAYLRRAIEWVTPQLEGRGEEPVVPVVTSGPDGASE